MGRRKGLFGRSKENKHKNVQQQTQTNVNDSQKAQGSSINHSSQNQASEASTASPLLVAKEKRHSDLANSRPSESSIHSNSNSSGTIFIAVNEDTSQSGKLSKGSSHKSLNSLLSKQQAFSLGKSTHSSRRKTSEDTSLERDVSRQGPQPSVNSDMHSEPYNSFNRSTFPPREMQPPGAFLQYAQISSSQPNVRMLVEQLFRIGGDFIVAERYLRLLRDALEIEGTSFQKGESELTFDPTDTFFCIKEVAESYYLRWSDLNMSKKEEMESRLRKSSNDENDITAAHRVSGMTEASSTSLNPSLAESQTGSKHENEFNAINLDDETWNEIEQISWEIFELSMWSCAVLAAVCVGPAWKKQINERRLRLQSASLEKMRRSNLDPSQHSMDSSMTLSQSNRQRVSFNGDEGSTLEINEEPGFAYHPAYPMIPEVLPISMLQFAASFGDVILPIPKFSDTEVVLTRLKSENKEEREEDKVDPDEFAASIEPKVWEERRNLIRRQRVGEAQRELVAALITDSGENDSAVDEVPVSGKSMYTNGLKRYKWNIPGAHDPVAIMVQSWLETTLIGWPEDLISELNQDSFLRIDSTKLEIEWGKIASNGALDWWNALQVSKCVSDLTQIGWRPPPSSEGNYGDDCVLKLMILAEKGILLLPQDMKNQIGKGEDTKEEIMEILAASSTSSEALAALNHLGGRGCLPHSTVKNVARNLCKLLSLTDGLILDSSQNLFFANMRNISEVKDDQIEQDLHDIMGLRLSCLHEIAELLWSMMARNSSMALTVDALLTSVNIDLSSIDPTKSDDHIISACGAVRSLGASLWGNPPQVRGNTSLRLCWSLFFEFLYETASSIHDWSQCQKSPVENSVAPVSSSLFLNRINDTGSIASSLSNTFLSVPKLKGAHEYNTLSLNLVLEVVVAVRRLIDGDMASGVDLLCRHEWEQLMLLLEKGLLPWLAITRSDDNEIHFVEHEHPALERGNEELMQKIQAEVSGIFIDIRVFLSLDGEGSTSKHRIIDENIRARFSLLFFRMVSPLLPTAAATHVALSVIDFWMRDEAISFSAVEWEKKCSSLLSEAFAVYDGVGFGYDGNYVHSPTVRQAAMRVLVQTDQTGVDQPEISSFSSVASTDIDVNAIVRISRNIHADTVCKLFLPYVSEVLHTSTIQNGLKLPVPQQIQKQEEIDHESQLLLLSTIQIIGDLLMCPALDSREHPKLLTILRTCVLDTPTPTRRNSSNGLLGDVLKLNDFGEICKLKLETVRQLGVYFRASFEARGDECRAPDIVHILNEVVHSFHKNSSYEVVAFAALFQMLCVRRKNDGKAMLLDEVKVLDSFSPSSLDFNERVIFVMETIKSHKDPDNLENLQNFETYHPETAKGAVTSSWIHMFVDSENTSTKDTKTVKKVQLNLRPLINTIISVLNDKGDHSNVEKSREASPYIEFITAKSSISFQLKALCFEMLKSWIQCGLVKEPLTQLQEISPLMESAPTCLAHCKLLSCYATFIAKDFNSERFFRQLLSSCASENVLISRAACRALSAYFATILNRNDSSMEMQSQWHQEACLSLVKEIRTLTRLAKEGAPHIPLLTTLLDVITSYNPMLHILSDRTKGTVVTLCHQICSNFSEMSPHTHLLCLMCASSAAATIGIDELVHLVSHISERQEPFSHSKSTPEEPDHLQVASVILDVLVQHCLLRYDAKKHRHNSINRYEREPPLKESDLSDIEIVAKDIADIESFDVAREEGHGAWLCNDLVLLCRIGSNESRNRGWVEIILRSPSTRVRKLVKLSRHLSVKRPDLPSNLWDSVQTSQEDTSMGFRQPSPLSAHDDSPNVDTKIVSKAKDVIERFRGLDENGKKKNGFEVHSQNSSLRSFMGFSADEISIIETSSSEQKREPEIIKGVIPDGGFRHFLYKALAGDEINMLKVENALHEIDCSIPILDSVYDYSDGPLPLKWGPQLRRAVNVLDRTCPFLQTHKIALMVANPPSFNRSGSRHVSERDSDSKVDLGLLSVENSSPLFSRFSSGLGSLTSLKHLRIFSGGMDTSDYASDGMFALCWIENLSDAEKEKNHFIGKTMVLFHSAPLMPPGLNTRKRHVGNDMVHIVFCEDPSTNISEDDFGSQIISGEFCFVTIFVVPMCDNSLVSVTVKVKEDLDEKLKDNLQHLIGSSLMPFDASPMYVRQLAIRADLACRSVLQDRLVLFSNWQERMKQIRNLRRYQPMHQT